MPKIIFNRKSVIIQHALGEADIIAAIEENSDNDFMLTGFDFEDTERPLELFYLDRHTHGHTRHNVEHFYIQNDDDLIIAALTLENDVEGMHIEQISVRPEYQSNGLGRMLINTAMQYAANCRIPLVQPDFTKQGHAAFATFFRKIHAETIDLAVQSKNSSHLTWGYELQP